MNDIEAHVMWTLFRELGVSYADASAFVEKHQMRSAGEACKPGAIRVGGADAFKKLAALRPALFVLQKVMDNYAWVHRNKLDLRDLQGVTYAEWTLFEGPNAGVMVAHGVAVSAVYPKLKGDTCKRYAILLELVTKRKSASLGLVHEELEQYDLAWDRDFLDFDPSCGTLSEHVLWQEEEPGGGGASAELETLCEAKARVPKVTVGEYRHFGRMHNALVLNDGVVWLKRALRVRTELPGLVSKMILDGATEAERESWVVPLFEG